MKELIKKYKNRITDLQGERDRYDSKGMSGACLSITGEIQAYNAVIEDLKNLIKEER